jgi:hypothetical protein
MVFKIRLNFLQNGRVFDLSGYLLGFYTVAAQPLPKCTYIGVGHT